jgi:hypothetical protein
MPPRWGISAYPREAGTARPLLERARDLRCSILGEDHPDTLRSTFTLAAALTGRA